ADLLRGPRPVRVRGHSQDTPPDASHDAFSSSLTTTVFSQRSMRWFGASLRRATPKGQDPSSPAQHRIKDPSYIGPSLRSGHTLEPHRVSGSLKSTDGARTARVGAVTLTVPPGFWPLTC